MFVSKLSNTNSRLLSSCWKTTNYSSCFQRRNFHISPILRNNDLNSIESSLSQLIKQTYEDEDVQSHLEIFELKKDTITNIGYEVINNLILNELTLIIY